MYWFWKVLFCIVYISDPSDYWKYWCYYYYTTQIFDLFLISCILYLETLLTITAFQCRLFKNSAALNCPFLLEKRWKRQLSKCFVWLCTSATVLPKSANLGTFHFVVKHTLVSGTAANEPVTHTLTVSHHELLMRLPWLTS